MHTFSIRVETEQPAVGRITIGDFSEAFELNCCRGSTGDYWRSWIEALHRLLADPGGTVALMTWRCPPPEAGVQRGWILFRSQSTVYVQERLFVPGEHQVQFDAAGQLIGSEPRTTQSEDGLPISEWLTSTRAIESFLRDEGDA